MSHQKSTLRTTAIFFALTLLFAAPAKATVLLTPQIDFRDRHFAAANRQQSFSTVVDGIAFTISAEVAGGGNATLWWDRKDGLGVRYNYEKDEIEGTERLRLSFASTIGISEIYISDLFVERGYSETGSYQIESSPAVTFDALSLMGTDGNKRNGEHLISIDPILPANEIVFFAPGRVNGQSHDFSLLGFTDPPLANPEPAALAIFGVGLAGLFLIRRRNGTA